MKKHETKKIRFNGLVEKTDIAIAPLIEQIWKAGIITSYSSVENENKIMIDYASIADITKFLKIVLKEDSINSMIIHRILGTNDNCRFR
ncbi:MAG TPA: hypothetical protein DF296_13275 [Candidatus Margulisbacteria bacterium]|nr:hypothetical protein [Candidatus Margulisiibacteriota bacterium]